MIDFVLPLGLVKGLAFDRQQLALGIDTPVHADLGNRLSHVRDLVAILVKRLRAPFRIRVNLSLGCSGDIAVLAILI